MGPASFPYRPRLLPLCAVPLPGTQRKVPRVPRSCSSHRPSPKRQSDSILCAARRAKVSAGAGFSVAFNGEAAPSSSLPTLSPEAGWPPLPIYGHGCWPVVNASTCGLAQECCFRRRKYQCELMFVGEAPGADEDIQGEPFVGRSRPVADEDHRDDGIDT